MVCEAEDYIHIIVRDLSNLTTQSRFVLEVPSYTTVSDFIANVSNFFNYEPESFELTLQKGQICITVSDKTPGTLVEAGFNSDPSSRNSVILTGHGSLQPVPKSSFPAVEDELSLGASASPTGCSGGSSSDYPPAPPLPPPVSSSSTTNSEAVTYAYMNSSSARIKHDIGYVGLVNQAMTCYLNSLLQALFMTPEFRNALYKWQFEANESLDETKSIPYQLQKLFLNLQTSNRNAVETTELTRSFGWDSSEAWQQHDIQELCRVMFEALEQVLKDTQQADLIDRLYQGKMIDYVKCLECSQEKSRQDTFLDIPLPVRPFGSTVAYGSVEEALRAFVQPETLEGNNQYHCDQCAKKCDAHKGLKFSKFPYLLTLHLKRFDFDYNTLHRIKLNDKVVFPEILDLNSFIQQEKEDGSEGFMEESATARCDDSSTTDSGSALDDESCQGANELPQNDSVQEDDEGIDMSGGTGNHHENEKNRQHTMQKGQFVYELFSIMIHSGSASGGHYYAYIKDFRNGEWFCFNDQSVSRITSDDIAKTYGGGGMRGYYSGAYSSSTNAYMLMYRQIDKERNCDAIVVDQFPPHIKDLYGRLQEREETDRQRKEKEFEKCKMKFFYYFSEDTTNTIGANLDCANDTPLKNVVAQAHQKLGLSQFPVPPLEQCRLVGFNPSTHSVEISFEGREEERITDIISILRSHKCELLMEVRSKDKKFIEYHPGDITLKIYYVDLEMEDVGSPTVVRCNTSQTVGDMKDKIGTVLNMDPSDIIVVHDKYNNTDLNILNDNSVPLKQHCVNSLMKVFVCRGPFDPEHFNSNKLHKILIRFENSIHFLVMLPDTDPETLHSLGIPALNSPSNNIAAPPVLDNNSDGAAHDAHGKHNSDNCISHSQTRPTKNSNPEDQIHAINDKCFVDNRAKSNERVVPGATANASGTPGDTEGGGRSRDLLLPLLLSGNTTTTTPTVTTSTVSAAATASTIVVNNVASVVVSSEAEETGSQGAGGGDHSTSEDSSLTDSDRTLIGDVPEEYTYNPPSEVIDTTDNTFRKFYEKCVYNNTDATNSGNGSDEWCESDDNVNNYAYFKATPYTDTGSEHKMFKVQVDKRMILDNLKIALEPYVGVPSIYFRVYRSFPSQQEYECTSLNDTLQTLEGTPKLCVKLGRALRGNEHRVKVFLLTPDATPPMKFLCDYVIAKGESVAETKRNLVDELSRKNLVKIPLDRCRLRKKNWKNPAKVYLDSETWACDIGLETNTDIIVQELPGPEILKSSSQLVIFIRRWYPSKYQLGPFQEIVMDDRWPSELKAKISEISDIPVENVDFAKPIPNVFPCDTSVLAIQDLEWNLNIGTIDQWPLQIAEDGSVLFYRDMKEEVKQLTAEERKEIITKESAKRNLPSSNISTYSPRKERPLKIYLDSAPRRPRTIVEPDID